MKIKQKILMGAMMLLMYLPVTLFYSPSVFADDCNGYETSILPCYDSIYGLLLSAINVLTGGIVIAAIGGFVYSAILYSSAGGNADNIKKAKTMITNIVIGIVAYVLMYAFLNYLIPGGIFN